MIFVLAIIVFVLFLVTITLGARGSKRYSWFEFYAKGRESGFSFRQTRELKELGRISRLGDPTEVFWSLKSLDRVIAAVSQSRKAGPRGFDRETERLLERMYEYRRRLEFDQPKYKYGIKSSHQLTPNQRIRILVHGVGVYNSTLADVNPRFLVCTYPVGVKLPPGFSWKGRRVSVYFWRQEDAGYVFDTYVIDDMRIRSVPVLHLAHSEALYRTQKRKSVRARSKISAYLYLLKRVEGAYEKPEREPGLKSILQDISEDGFAVMIGGKAKAGIHVKAQFFLGDEQVVMSGTVRGFDYWPEKNRSLIHVEAVRPSPRIRNIIRSYVYASRAAYSEGQEEGGDVFASVRPPEGHEA